MARFWTSAQRAAIDARDADVLVAAAAGSGKTAVLVERIINRITDETQPVDLDRLLVVTFTNAAAAEMRQRIGAALTERLEQFPGDQVAARQLTLLPRASITTIHAFCHRILRSNFHLLDLDPGFRLADPTENELIRLSALEEVIDEMYEDPIYAKDFLALTEAYLNIRQTEDFYGLLNHIYDFAMSLPNPKGWLSDSAERFLTSESEKFDDSPFAEPVLEAGIGKIRAVAEKYNTMIRLADSDDGGADFASFLMAEQAMLLKLLSADTYDAFCENLSQISFQTIPRVPKGAQPRYRDTIRDMRDAVKKDVKKLLAELFSMNGKEQAEMLRKLYPLMRCLSETVCRLMLRFDEKKTAKNLLNYNDLEHGCYRLFVDEEGSSTPLAETVKEQFDEILIDEYQDTSALQEAIFSAIKKEGGLFLVGDVKQSIYRFRNTNPLLFREKKEQYSEAEDAPCRKIILSKNFRSRAGVLACINYVFTRLMSDENGEIDYNEEEMLYPGLAYPAMEHPMSEDSELLLVETGDAAEEEESLEAIEAEAVLAAQKIQALMSEKRQVLGKNGPRQLAYRDFAILMRSTKSTADCFAKTLAAYGIPCYSEVGSSFLQSEEITVMLSLLKIIDNPHQDIPLLAVLRSQMYAFLPDELAEIRLSDRQCDFFDALKKRATVEDALGGRLAEFVEKLSVYREKSRQLGTAELVWYLYMQTGFYEAQATLPGGTLRRLNLRLLYTRAAAFEKTGLKGLYSFVRFIDEYQAIGGDYDAARTIGEEQDVVRIMSIHKSKGLEFPVVLLAGMGRKFNLQDLQKKVLIHSELGYGPQYIDTDLGVVYQNAARAAVKQTLYGESLSEELRILYVAMTRAREKLIMIGSGKNLSGRIKKCVSGSTDMRVSGAFAREAGSYLDWLFMALVAHPDGAILREMSETDMAAPVDHEGRFSVSVTHIDELSMPQAEEIREVQAEPGAFEQLAPLLDSSYAFSEETTLPTKVTVTEVKRALQETEYDTVYLYPRPDFLKNRKEHLSSAEAGTAMHTVLERLDYQSSDSIEAIDLQIETLRMQGLLSEEEAAVVDRNKLLSFMKSPIGQRLKNAPKVLREVSFGVYASAEELLNRSGTVMLQGIIDCVLFEEAGISILDYKTDRGENPDKVAECYKIQLDCYAKAAETMYGMPVVHRYLYLFHFDCLIEL